MIKKRVSKKRRKPQIVKVSKEWMGKRLGKGSSNVDAMTVGSRIYVTPKASKMDMEHELAHYKLRHRPKTMTAYTFARREVIAEKMAADKLKRKVSKGYLDELRKDIKSTWGKHTTDKKELSFRARDAVNKAAKRYGLKHRV